MLSSGCPGQKVSIWRKNVGHAFCMVLLAVTLHAWYTPIQGVHKDSLGALERCASRVRRVSSDLQ
jgi:hypothetical protein